MTMMQYCMHWSLVAASLPFSMHTLEHMSLVSISSAVGVGIDMVPTARAVRNMATTMVLFTLMMIVYVDLGEAI